MGPTAVGTAAGAAVLTVGRGILGAAAGGISFVAELAKAAGAGGARDSEPVLTEVDQVTGEATADLQARIKEHLAQAGIRLTRDVELASDGAGGICVVGSHPEQAAIQEALASEFLLERDFQELAAQAEDFRLTVPA